MSQENVRLVPLATMTLEVRPPLVIESAPNGARWIVEAASGRIEGERLRARLTGAANADWFTLGEGSVGAVDARLLAETDDGALVLLQYHGRVDLSSGPAPIYIAPRFEAGDERYRWLNLVQAVGKGRFADRSRLVYDLFEVA